MTDLTRLFAHEMAAGLRRGDFSARELTDAHLDRDRANRRSAARLGLRRSRRAPVRRPTPPTSASPRAEGGSSTPAAAARHPRRAQGPGADRGRPGHRRQSRSSRATSARTTRTSPSDCAPPARCCPARPTWTSSRWARRPSTRRGDRRPTRGTSTACRAVAAAARRRPWRPTTCRCRSAPTPAARSASRRR